MIDPQTGQVLALVGEMDASGSQGSLSARRVGSLMTPFIYLTGFARGMSPGTLAWDIPGGLSGTAGEMANPDGRISRAGAAARGAGQRLLGPAAEVLVQLGAESVHASLLHWGFPSRRVKMAPLLGNVLLTPLEAARAYGVFGNKGVLAGWKSGETIQPAAVLKVDTVDHAPWLTAPIVDMQAVASPQLAYLMTDVLRDPTARRDTEGALCST